MPLNLLNGDPNLSGYQPTHATTSYFLFLSGLPFTSRNSSKTMRVAFHPPNIEKLQVKLKFILGGIFANKNS